MTNIIIISGRITKELALVASPSGTEYVRFAIANDTGYGDKKKTNFIDVTAFGKTAESLCKFRTKGSTITIEGQLEQNSYTDKDGNKRTSYGITARSIDWDWDSVPKDGATTQSNAAKTEAGYFDGADEYAPF